MRHPVEMEEAERWVDWAVDPPKRVKVRKRIMKKLKKKYPGGYNMRGFQVNCMSDTVKDILNDALMQKQMYYETKVQNAHGTGGDSYQEWTHRLQLTEDMMRELDRIPEC